MPSSPNHKGRLEVRGLKHAFGELPVLAGIDLTLAPGEFVAIVGPSGCGKSSLLKAVAGLLVPSSGEVALNGASLAGVPGSAAYLPQSDSLLPWRRALANATVGAEVSGVPAKEARTKALGLFDRFGLSGFENAWPHELSGGMRQRVAVLRTFLLTQPLLALDEPFASLDALTKINMHQWLEEVWLSDPRTALLVTHDIDEAYLLADRILVMSDRPGRIIDEITVDLPRPRTIDESTSAQFGAVKQRILSALSER